MSSDGSNCCCSTGKMGKGRHDFMARVEDEIVVVKDVPDSATAVGIPARVIIEEADLRREAQAATLQNWALLPGKP